MAARPDAPAGRSNAATTAAAAGRTSGFHRLRGGVVPRGHLTEPRPLSDRIGDVGQLFGDLPQPVLQVLVVRLLAGRHQLGVAALLTQTIGAVVLPAFDVRV